MIRDMTSNTETLRALITSAQTFAFMGVEVRTTIGAMGGTEWCVTGCWTSSPETAELWIGEAASDNLFLNSLKAQVADLEGRPIEAASLRALSARTGLL